MGNTPRNPKNYSFTGLKNVYNEGNVNVKIHAVRNFFCYRGAISSDFNGTRSIPEIGKD